MCKVEKRISLITVPRMVQTVNYSEPLSGKKENNIMATTATKRRFYNTGDAKGFTKAVFYQTVAQLLNGEEIENAEELTALCIEAANYELEGLEIKAAQKGATPPGEKKDPLQSDYAHEIRAAILPLLTSDPQTAKSLIEQATAHGKVASKSGKPFGYAWVCRVMNVEPGVVATKIIGETTDKDGLKKQVPQTAYARG